MYLDTGRGGLDCMLATVIRWLGVEANSLLDNVCINFVNKISGQT